MTLSLLDLVRSEFRTSRAADEMNSRFQTLLGLPHRYGPARLALGRSLGLATVPTFELNHLGYGRPIRGEHLFGQGAELATWVTLLVEHAATVGLERRDLQALVAAHWQRGMTLLWDDWRAAGSDFDRFVTRLVRHAEGRGGRSAAKA
jgi:hypothetical protein